MKSIVVGRLLGYFPGPWEQDFDEEETDVAFAGTSLEGGGRGRKDDG